MSNQDFANIPTHFLEYFVEIDNYGFTRKAAPQRIKSTISDLTCLSKRNNNLTVQSEHLNVPENSSIILSSFDHSHSNSKHENLAEQEKKLKKLECFLDKIYEEKQKLADVKTYKNASAADNNHQNH